MWTDVLDRQKLVEMAYQKGKELNLNNNDYLKWLDAFFDKEYHDDVGTGDITSKAILTKNEPITAFLKAKASGVIGGLEEVSWFLRKHCLDSKSLQKRRRKGSEWRNNSGDLRQTKRHSGNRENWLKCSAENVWGSHRN